MAVNKVILIGNLGKEPESRQVSETTCTTFSIATTEKYKNKAGEQVENTEWHNIVMWRGLADVAAKYLKKGSKVYLEGKIKYESYEKDGEKKYVTKIVADKMEMLSSGDKSEGSNNESTHEKENTGNDYAGDDSLPF